MYRNEFEAIRRFFFLAMNFHSVEYRFRYSADPDKVYYVPDFICEVRWLCNTDHMANKWLECVDNTNDTDAYLMAFFRRLDDSNRRLLVDWMMENYKG